MPSTFLTLLLVFGAALTAPRALAQTALVEEDDAETRLRGWMEIRARRNRRGRDLGLGIAGSTALVGAGVGIRLADDELETTIGSVVLFGSGALLLALAIARAVSDDIEADDVRQLPDRRLTERELGRLEGRLELDAQREHHRRRQRGFIGGAHLVVGLASMILVATGDDLTRRSETITYGAFAGVSVVGLVLLVTSLFETASEADWREYRQGLVPRASAGIRWHWSLTGVEARF